MRSLQSVLPPVIAVIAAPVNAQEPEGPNTPVIWGDDIGMWNISAYHRSMMGGSTPIIERIAAGGMPFMDQYTHASCTAGRATFITGQCPIRLSLSTVGLPVSPIGRQGEDPTLAVFLKELGKATGQFGKNHPGDRDEQLPTNHGFDEFFGIIYHVNAGEYVEQYGFTNDPGIARFFAQRGLTHSRASDDGGREIEDLGPFGTEVQRTLDEKVLQQSLRFIREAVAAGEPCFVWHHNTTRMHYRANLSPEYDGVTGYGLYADGMTELDDDVGVLLELLDELGIANTTMVMFSTGNGAASNSWPDGANRPFRGEKGVGGYEGSSRVPMIVKWPGIVPESTTTGEFMTMEDWLPTIMAQAGRPNLRQELLDGTSAMGRAYNDHPDGYDRTPILTGGGRSNRREYFYLTETPFHGPRFGDWKFLFKVQDKWFNSVQNDLVTPLIANLKLDPCE